MSQTPGSPLPPTSRFAGRLLIAAAALMWSTSGFFVKAPLFAGWPGPLLAFWRAAFASLVLVPLVRQPRWSWRLLPMLLAFTTMNWFYLSALVNTEAGNAIWLQYTSPVWVFLVSALVLREPVRPLDWLLLAFAVVGVGLIVVCEFRGQSIVGVTYGLLSGVTFAGIALSLRWLRDFDAAWLVALNHLVTALVLAPYAVANYPALWPSGWQWPFVAGLGILQMGLPYLLFARGLKYVPSHEAAGITLLEPLLVPVWVFVAWRNAANYTPPRWWTLLGGGLILLGLLVRYSRRPGRTTAEERPIVSGRNKARE